MRAQEAVAQPVEGTHPHAAHGDRQHRAQPREHFLGGLVGESHGQHAAWRELPGLDQPGDAGGQHARLARAGTGQDQRRTRRQRDRGELLGVEPAQQAFGGGQRGTLVGRDLAGGLERRGAGAIFFKQGDRRVVVRGDARVL